MSEVLSLDEIHYTRKSKIQVKQRNTTLSFEQVEQAEKKLWMESKCGRTYNFQNGKEVNHVKQFRTHHQVLDLSPFSIWKSQKSDWEHILLQLLLIEGIECYRNVVNWENSGALYFWAAVNVENVGKAQLFIGHLVNYGSLAWNFATCVVAKKKITFEMYTSTHFSPLSGISYCPPSSS